MASNNDALSAKEKLPSEFNIKFNLIPKTLTEPFTKDFPGYYEGLVRADPGGITLTPDYARDALDIYNFKPRPDDVWTLSFPKSGTGILFNHPSLFSGSKRWNHYYQNESYLLALLGITKTSSDQFSRHKLGSGSRLAHFKQLRHGRV